MTLSALIWSPFGTLKLKYSVRRLQPNFASGWMFAFLSLMRRASRSAVGMTGIDDAPVPPKIDPRKAALFNQVLEKVTGGVPGVVIDDLPEAAAIADPVAEEAVIDESVIDASVAQAEAQPPAKPKSRSKKA